MNRTHAWILAASLVTGFGCDAPADRTQVTVVVDAEDAIAEQTKRLEFRVWGGSGRDGAELSLRLTEELRPDSGFPVRLALVPLDQDATRVYRVEVNAYDAQEERVATIRALSGYRQGQSLRLDLLFEDRCARVQCDDLAQTCRAGECMDAQRDVGDLMPLEPPAPIDAGADAPMNDEDAGSCTDDAECDDGLDCTADGCSENGVCAFAPDDARCDDEIECTIDSCDPETGCTAEPSDTACDDGVACTVDRCDPETGCAFEPTDALCEQDDNPCTVARCTPAGCVAEPVEGACDDGNFCNGTDQCVDGTCGGHSGNPCMGDTVCDAERGACVGCATDSDCPSDIVGEFGACDYDDTCDDAGTQRRQITSFTCRQNECVPQTRQDTRSCSRDTNGTSCGETSCGGFGACDGFSSACDQTGTESRTCVDRVCRGGTCQANERTDSRACNRNTNGSTCAATSCGSFGTCGNFGSTCDESGSQSRTCTDHVCREGMCQGTARSESRACSRDTDGTTCANTTCGGFGACQGFSNTCDESGSQNRTCVDHRCASGSCRMQERSEPRSCSRDTDGNDCGSRSCSAWSSCSYSDRCATSGTRTRTCQVPNCASGSCATRTVTERDHTSCNRPRPPLCTPFECSPACRPGTRCCDGRCYEICP